MEIAATKRQSHRKAHMEHKSVAWANNDEIVNDYCCVQFTF